MLARRIVLSPRSTRKIHYEAMEAAQKSKFQSLHRESREHFYRRRNLLMRAAISVGSSWMVCWKTASSCGPLASGAVSVARRRLSGGWPCQQIRGRARWEWSDQLRCPGHKALCFDGGNLWCQSLVLRRYRLFWKKN